MELPEYPPLPVVDGRPVLNELETWQILRDSREYELRTALKLVEGDASPQANTERSDIIERLDTFATWARFDLAFLGGYIAGRTELVLGVPDHTRRDLDDVAGAYDLGRAGGLRESADRLAQLGSFVRTAELRARAEALIRGVQQ